MAGKIKERKEKVLKLKEVANKLKEEFVGLDSIIDNIIQAMYPWYVTPEVIDRPIIVSIWGMTGTGKTSVVKRLMELLDYNHNTLFIDCGEEAGETTSYSLCDDISNFIAGEDREDCSNTTSNSNKTSSGPVFVLDEFQYSRTIDEEGCEINKASLRPIWSLIDSGYINYNEWMYGTGVLKTFIVDLEEFCSKYNDISLKNCIITNEAIHKDYINTLGYFYYNRNPLEGKIDFQGRPSYVYSVNDSSDPDEDKGNPYRPLNIMNLEDGNIIRVIMKKMESKGMGLGKQTLESLYNATSLSEVLDILKNVERVALAPKIIDCHKSLVFIIGNLDEAFRVEDNLSPDMDANTFNDITSQISIQDIKDALKTRFRAEQIARLGNNLIKYPTLRQEHFKKIIEKELDRVFNRFTELEGVKINYNSDIINLAYSEGVFPTQGVRPVFTTIGTLLTPLLSHISVDIEDEKEVTISVKSDYPKELEFRVPKINIVIDYGNEKKKEIPINLDLGTLRYPKKRLRRFSSSVHEVGHAILASWCTGNIPSKIVSVSTDDGGFCETYNKKTEREIQNISDVKNEIMICLAGYLAEELVFGKGKPDSILLGSSSDLRSAWSTLNSSVYECGMFDLHVYTDKTVQPQQTPFPLGFSNSDIEPKLRKLWDSLIEETTKILIQEKKILKETALLLTEVGCIGENDFKFMIEKYGNKLTLPYLETIKNQEDWYRKTLLDF